MISIALIEDNRLVREGIAALLAQLPDMQVVAGASSVTTLLLRAVSPQVILLDLGLRQGDSLRAAEQLKKTFPESRVIGMDLFPVHEDIVEFIGAGVSGFVLKDATLDDLANTIRSVAGGVKILPPEMTASLFSQIAKEAVATQGAAALDAVRMTKREREVINLIAEGLSNKEIAGQLRIATHTVKSHVRNVMEKLTLHTRLQISAYAHRSGPLDSETEE